jgi:hypothetical protein
MAGLQSPRHLLVAAFLALPWTQVRAQIPSNSFWLVGRADVIGLRGPSGSPALFGGDLMLLRRLGQSQWEGALVLSASSRDRGPFYGRTWGLYSELRYQRRPVHGPYLIGVLGLANTRVDDNFLHPLADIYHVGTDATTAVIGAGAGLRFRAFRTGAFLDVQYHWRTNAAHGRHAVPLRLGFRW